MKQVTIGDASAQNSRNENRWGMKIGALIELIQTILKTEGEDRKILVYSQWEDSLLILGKVLKY